MRCRVTHAVMPLRVLLPVNALLLTGARDIDADGAIRHAMRAAAMLL